MENFMTHHFTITDIAFCGYVDRGLGIASRMDRRNNLLLFSVGKETKRYEFPDGKFIDLHCNEILFLPIGSSYVTKTLPTGSFYMIEFLTDNTGSFQPFAYAAKDTAKIQNNFSAAAKIYKRKYIAYKMQIMSLLYDIIATMQTECNKKYITTDLNATIAPAFDYIHSNYTKEQFNISELAEMCKISEDYFRKIFKSIHGISPRKYINRLKTIYAAELINSGAYTITDACYLSGFENTSYFSREFRKRYGISPLEYKRMSNVSSSQ